MKKRITIIVVLVLSIAMLGTGAFAYFSSTRIITGSTISTGTLELLLKNDCRGANTALYGETASAWNFAGMVPGEYVDQTICFKNNGTVAAGRVWYNWSDLLETPAGRAFADKLLIIDIQDNDDGGNVVTELQAMNIHSLYDLANAGGDPGFDAWSATHVYPYLTAGEEGWMYMKLQFDPNAGNEFQGITLTYKLTLEARQVLPGNQ
jgi:hypothetical protein